MRNEVVVNGKVYVEKDMIDALNPESAPSATVPAHYPFVIGEKYYFEQVTKYFTGRLVRMTDDVFVVDQCAWIADTGRYADAMKSGEFREVEPFADGLVFLSRAANILVRPFAQELPREQKG